MSVIYSLIITCSPRQVDLEEPYTLKSFRPCSGNYLT